MAFEDMSHATDTVIRTGESKDATGLSKIAKKLFDQTYAGKMPAKDLESYIAEEFGHFQQLAELQDTGVTTLIAEYCGELVGYAQVRKKPVPVGIDANAEIELSRIYVDKSCHGLGIGKLLLIKVKEVAASLSCDQIWLGVWEQNRRAISFYEKHGFAIVGSQAFNIGTQVQKDLVMQGSVSAF